MVRDILIEKRLQQQLTRKQVSELSGISESDYEVLENGNYRKISPRDYRLLKDILMLGKRFEMNYVSSYEDITRFKELRKELGYSLAEASEKTGVCSMMLWKLEQGEFKRVSQKTFNKLKKGYNIKDDANYDHLILTKHIKLRFINDDKFYELVKEKREKLELTQGTLASIAHVSPALISRLEKNERRISLQTAIKLMSVLEFTEKEKKHYLIRK